VKLKALGGLHADMIATRDAWMGRHGGVPEAMSKKRSMSERGKTGNPICRFH
jgi:hypothetical protein